MTCNVFYQSIVIWDSLLITWKKSLRSQITYADFAITYVDSVDQNNWCKSKIIYIRYKSFILTHSHPNGAQ